jgi:carbon monoxide dehydrogenase subunit G
VKVTGTATLNAPRAQVWAALNDPAVLVRTIPGCQQLEEIGPSTYRMTISAGVASVKGTYDGDVRLTDHAEPESFVLRASGAGAPGTVSADVMVTLEETSPDVTLLEYAADAVVGGMIGGVGQRVLAGVAKKTAGEFFRAVDDVLTGVAPAVPSPRGEAAVPAGSGSPEHGGAPGIYTPPAAGPRGAVASGDFLRGAVVGAMAALAGVLVGGFVSRRRG